MKQTDPLKTVRQIPPQKNLDKRETGVFFCLTGHPHASQSTYILEGH